MADAMGRWANPSSPHAEGRAARAALEDARARLKAALGWQYDLIFTSGATEALAMALSRTDADARLASSVEHDAIHRVAPDAFIVPVASDGVVAAATTPSDATGTMKASGATRWMASCSTEEARRASASVRDNAIASASVAPLVKIRSYCQPRAAFSLARASSSAARAARPSAWGEDGLAQRPIASAIASRTEARIGVVAA